MYIWLIKLGGEVLTIKKDSLSTTRTMVRRNLIYFTFIFAILACLFIYQHYHNKARQLLPKHGQVLPVEQSDVSETRQLLASHDYYNYQVSVTGYVDDYIMLKEYPQAEDDLNQIISNVPPDKITSDTYHSYWYLYLQKGDVANRKKYALLTAQKLKQEGNAKAAAEYEQDANSK